VPLIRSMAASIAGCSWAAAQFPFRGVRYALLVLGAALLAASLVQLAQLPRPAL